MHQSCQAFANEISAPNRHLTSASPRSLPGIGGGGEPRLCIAAENRAACAGFDNKPGLLFITASIHSLSASLARAGSAAAEITCSSDKSQTVATSFLAAATSWPNL